MVIALGILILVLTALLVLILFTPVVLIINSVTDHYRVQWGPAHAQVWFTEDPIRFRLHIPFWTREGALHELMSGSKDEPTHHRRDSTVMKRRSLTSRWRPSVWALLKSFRVRRLRWSLDTGDVLWNAWLYPAFQALHAQGHDLVISFTGRNELELVIDNNLYRVLKVVLLRSTTTKTPRP